MEYFDNKRNLEEVIDSFMSAWDSKKGYVYFSFYKGDIISNPRKDEDIEKIKEITTVLYAKAQGDDGELYK